MVSSKRNKIPLSRSEIMSRIRSKDTGPERIVRSALHRLGFRYKLHVKDLPGCPDIVFSAKRKAIFVHGCFWHGHGCGAGFRVPNTNRSYWVEKIEKNKIRDTRSINLLEEAGWKVMIVWECELDQLDDTVCRIVKFLSSDK